VLGFKEQEIKKLGCKRRKGGYMKNYCNTTDSPDLLFENVEEALWTQIFPFGAPHFCFCSTKQKKWGFS
jgi:hypothetical protein